MRDVMRACGVLLGLCLTCTGSAADTLDTIKQRGSLIVGVKTDYRPWGSKDQRGVVDGMEIELARDLARRLKVKLELVPALSSTRVQLLNDGKVDLILATFSVTAERNKQVTFIEPGYYAAMTGVIAPAKAGFVSEASIKGHKICGVAGNYANKPVAGLVGKDLVEFKTLTEAEDKLREGQCEGVAFDDVALLYQIKSEADKWKDYDLSVLPSVTPVPWALAVKLGEKDSNFTKFLSNTVKEWHRKGKLLTLEKKWVGGNSMALQWLSEKVKLADQSANAAKGNDDKAAKPKPVPKQTPRTGQTPAVR